MFAGRPTIYLAGNHEFYGQNAPDHVEKMRRCGRELGVFVLSDDDVVINGVRFPGATLWTDFALLGDPRAAMLSAQVHMVDYRKIRLSPSYASDLDAMVASAGAAYWIHGHTHHNVRYRIGSTTVIANQRGYPDDPPPGFDAGLVVDISSQRYGG